MTPSEQLPKGKKTALRDVVESGTVPGMAKKGPAPTQQAQPGKATTTADAKKAPPAKAKLTLKAVPPLEYHPKRDFAALLAGLVACDSGAAPKFDPPLSTVRAAKDYDITVTAPATDKLAAPDPVHLKFAILPADAKFTVGTPADYVVGTVTDLLAHIAPHCEGEADEKDLFSFAPPLDQAGLKAGPCKVVVTLKERSNYRPEAPKTVEWKVLKKVQSLKLPVIADHAWASDKSDSFIKSLPQQFEKRPADQGALCFDPPLKGCKYEVKEYSFKVWLEENDLYQKSEVEVLTFKIFMNAMDCSTAFSEWWKKADQKKQQKLGGEKKAKVKYCGDPLNKIPPPENYTTKEQLFAVLNNASAGLKSRAEIWAALGYPGLAGPSDWVLGTVPNTSKGGKAHLTISFGNISTPTTLDFWKKSDSDIYDGLFKGPTNVAMRVHASLEDQPETGRNYHVFLGDTGYVSGDNKARKADGFEGQVGELFAALDNFKTTMVSRIGTNKAALGTAS